MSWRVLHITSAERLKILNRSLVVVRDTGDVIFPLEDIACVVLDHQYEHGLMLSEAVLRCFSEHNIALIVPNEKHQPAGILLPFSQHYIQSEVAYLQVETSLPLKKRLWQSLVVQKIINHARVIETFIDDPFASKELLRLSKDVKSGDPDNIEAYVARIYWRSLFGDRFIRRGDLEASEDRRNGLLNYGYAIVASAIARSCAGHGLLTMFGVHHCAKLNPINLVYDIIEPFRAFVDKYTLMRLDDEPLPTELTKGDRQFMVSVLQASCEINGEYYTLINACEEVVTSIVSAYRNGDASNLKVPLFIME